MPINGATLNDHMLRQVAVVNTGIVFKTAPLKFHPKPLSGGGSEDKFLSKFPQGFKSTAGNESHHYTMTYAMWIYPRFT